MNLTAFYRLTKTCRVSEVDGVSGVNEVSGVRGVKPTLIRDKHIATTVSLLLLVKVHPLTFKLTLDLCKSDRPSNLDSFKHRWIHGGVKSTGRWASGLVIWR